MWILYQLFVNAIERTKQNTVKVKVSFTKEQSETSLRVKQNRLKIEVVDFGIKLSDRQIEDMYSP